MSAVAARNAFTNRWDGSLPVNSTSIAQSMGVEIVDLGEVFSRFESVDGKPHIVVSPGLDDVLRRYVVAHGFGHYMLRRAAYGARLKDTVCEFPPERVGIVDQQANLFAITLLIPGMFVRTLIMKRNMLDPRQMKDVFGVTVEAMELRLKN